MKKRIALAAILMLTSVFLGPAHAGSARQHTAEGFVLGAGAVLIGAAIVHGLNDHEAVHYRPVHSHWKHGSRHPKKAVKVWVPPVYESRWIPGHHSRKGRWVPGCHKTVMVSQGYWVETWGRPGPRR